MNNLTLNRVFLTIFPSVTLGIILGAILMFLFILGGCRPRDDGDNRGGNGNGRWSLHEHGNPLEGRGPKNPSGK